MCNSMQKKLFDYSPLSLAKQKIKNKYIYGDDDIH